MSFLLKSAFWLALVFIALPQKEADRVKAEFSTAIGQDTMVRTAVDRTQKAMQVVTTEAQRLCDNPLSACLETAASFAKAAAATR